LTTKEYLQGVKELGKKINADLCELSQLRQMIGAIGAVNYAKDRVQVSPENSLEKSIVRLISLEEKINQQIDCFIDLKGKIRGQISELGKTDEKLILQYRYLCFMSWEMIAVSMNYSYRQTLRIHSRALKSFETWHTMSH
jgi:Protein of unknown function (DUF1492).